MTDKIIFKRFTSKTLKNGFFAPPTRAPHQLRHNSYFKWAVGATMVWCTPANKTPRLSSDTVVSCCGQTNCPCHVKSMGIISIHEWKVPLKYRGMHTFPSGPLGLGQAAYTMVWGGGTYKMAGLKIYKHTITEAT